MGTNYYVTTPACANACAHCREQVQLHVGKSSMGWRFLCRAYPDLHGLDLPLTEPVVDRASWLRLINLGPLADEYGREISTAELLELIDNKQGGLGHGNEHGSPRFSTYQDLGRSDFRADGYDFCSAEFS